MKRTWQLVDILVRCNCSTLSTNNEKLHNLLSWMFYWFDYYFLKSLKQTWVQLWSFIYDSQIWWTIMCVQMQRRALPQAAELPIDPARIIDETICWLRVIALAFRRLFETEYLKQWIGCWMLAASCWAVKSLICCWVMLTLRSWLCLVALRLGWLCFIRFVRRH